MFGSGYFGVIDYVAVALTLLISLGIGIYHAVKGHGKETNEDLLLGGRKMKALPIAASMLVTYFSAIAIIGYPAEIYSNGIQIFWIHLFLTFICIPLAAFLFMSVLYKLKLTSAYEYLELRFDSVVVRWIASAIFIIQMTFMTGVVLYAPSIPLQAFLGLPKWASIVGIGVIGTIYTSIGGLKAVVWTDVFQFFLIIIGMVTIVTRGFYTAGGVEEAFHRAYEMGRLELFNWNVDPFERYNTLNFVLGYALAIICFYGAHQPNVQRYSSLPTFKDALKAMAWNAVLKELTNILIICTGVSIFATYAKCDPILLGDIKKPDEIVPYFFIKELSWIPGMMGLFTSCIFSAVLSTLSSTLNSLAAVTWQDFLSKIPYFQSMTKIHKGNVTMITVVCYGMITMSLAFIAGQFGSIFQLTIIVIGAFGGTLGGIFIMGIFIPCVNKIGASLGVVLGLLSTSILTYKAIALAVPYGTLPTTIDGCPPDTNLTNVIVKNVTVMPDYEWPTKLFSISYILYPLIGCSVTIITGVLISIIARFFIQSPPDSCYLYLHPIVQRMSSASSEEKPTVSEIKKNDDSSDSKGHPIEKFFPLHVNTNANVIGLRIVQKEI